MTVDTKEVVTTIAYMIGVRMSALTVSYGECSELIEKLQADKDATTIRYLCKLRTVLMQKFKKTDDLMRYQLKNLHNIERLSDKSGYLRFKSNFLGNIRMELSKMLAMLDSQKESFSSKAGTEYEHFDHEARLRILKTFSATVNMTELAKYFSGNFTTEYQSLSDICGEVCDEEGNLLEEDGCIFRYSIDPCIYFETNKSLIKNVLVNLLVNAYMYNDKEQRQVELILKTEGDRIILSISDNGNGMTDDVWQAAITPFGTFQKYSSSEALGLALAKCFCDRFDGELSYRSEIGKGTCVTMSFPCDSRGLPKEFHVSRMPPIPNPYGSTYCIMAKGLDPLK